VKLFDEFERSDPLPKHQGEDSFAFLNRVSTPFWAVVRQTVEEWFSRYPEAEQRELRSGLRSRLSGRHFGAWWELYLHELFLRLGYAIEVHPTLAWTKRRPDFRITRDGRTALVEAAALFSGISSKGGPTGAAPGWMSAAVEAVESPDFFINYDEVLAEGEDQLKRKEVAEPLKEWIDGLDADQVRVEIEKGEEPPEFVLRRRGWEVGFYAWPLKPDRRGRPDHRVVGAGPAMGGPVDDIDQLESKLKAKAGRYGRPEEPFVIAVLCLSSFMERLDIEQALFGREAVVIEGKGTGRLVRQRNGFWFRGEAPINRRVSAVLTAVCVQPWSVTKIAPELWLNPWAERELGKKWPFTRSSANDSGEILREEGDPDMAGLFGLPREWPPGEPFPRDDLEQSG
jgi:hypothetical protein